jgi:hypothetical protein
MGEAVLRDRVIPLRRRIESEKEEERRRIESAID